MGLGLHKSMYHNKRPVFLQLHRIHLPVTGLVSISHRLTGALLFLSLPLWLYLLQHSLHDEAGYQAVQGWFGHLGLRLLVGLLIWWFLHHLLAGLRVLLLDIDLGVDLPQARASASGLMWVSLLLLLLLLWLVV